MIYTILETNGNVIVKKTLKETVIFLTNYGERDIFEDGNIKILKLTKKDIEWYIKEEDFIYFHTNPTKANYQFRVQKHKI